MKDFCSETFACRRGSCRTVPRNRLLPLPAASRLSPAAVHTPPRNHVPAAAHTRYVHEIGLPARSGCSYLPRNRLHPAVHTRYVHEIGLPARSGCTYLCRNPVLARPSRCTYQVCTRNRPSSAFWLYIPPTKPPSPRCTYQVCTRNRPSSAFQLYIPPPKCM